MSDTGCEHPDDAVIKMTADFIRCADWCSICGSVRWIDGVLGVDRIEGVEWRGPSGIVLPGWTCICGTFNGAGKELLSECRHCGTSRKAA